MYRYSIVTWNVQKSKTSTPDEIVKSILHILKLTKPQILMLQEYPNTLGQQVNKLLQDSKYISLRKFLTTQNNKYLELDI